MNLDIQYYKRDSSQYPQILNRYERMPEGLYVCGSFPDPEKRSVSIVGARSCSEYGRSEAMRFAKVLAEHGVQIISGMALGIDSAAHEGALQANGRTFAVLGSGVDVCYPATKIRLYERILQTGGIISEYPPGTPAAAYHFPARNRIISGLADAVIVIEARKKSGSLITAMYALEEGKTIYALPGRISDSLSEGTNDLICQGAIPAVSPEQILRDFGIITEETSAEDEWIRCLTKEEKRIVTLLSKDPVSLDTLHEKSGLSLPETGKVLTGLTLKNRIREPYPGWYIIT